MTTTSRTGNKRPTRTVMLGIKVDSDFKHELEKYAADIDSDMSKLGRLILSQGLAEAKATLGQTPYRPSP